MHEFVWEARVTAKLQHPGIPPVHDFGALPDGRPFLAMKLIRGRTLAALLKDRPNSSHDLPRFIDIFEQICQAVGYAHSQGFINRDLKPANVMVGSFGEVQVIDWGLALALMDGGFTPPGSGVEHADSGTEPSFPTDPLARTRAGTVVGTPAYMPPEQARGEAVDVRADVFALGGILFEILTGGKVYGHGTTPVILHRAANEMLADARAGLAACGADAELIALAKRCLAPRPDRPADGKAVAEAIAAYRAGVEERLRVADREKAAAEAKAAEQRKRRRLRLALAATLGLLVVGGAAVAWWRDKEQTRAETAGEGWLIRCEEALRGDDAEKAEVALKEAESRLAGNGRLMTRLDRCRTDLGLLRELDDIENARWLAGGGQRQPDTAAERWREAFRRYGVVPGTTPHPDAALRVREAHVTTRALTAMDKWLSRTGGEELAAILGMADPDPYRDEVRDAARRRDAGRVAELATRPEGLEQPPRFAVVLASWGRVPAERRKEILLVAHRARPKDFEVLMALGNLYPIDRREGADERVGWFRAALAASPTSPAAWTDLGVALGDRGDVAGAVLAHRQALRFQPNSPVIHNNLGVAFQTGRDWDAAEAAFAEATRLDPTHPAAHSNMGIVRTARKDWKGVEAAFGEAIRLDPNEPSPHYNVGAARAERGDLMGAEAAYKEATRVAPGYAAAYHGLGLLRAKQEDGDSAAAYFETAIKFDPAFAEAHYHLGVVFEIRQNWDRAIACYWEAVRLNPKHVLAQTHLGAALTRNGEPRGAVIHLREAIRLDPNSAEPHYWLGIALRRLTDLDGAIRSLREAVRLDPGHAPTHQSLGISLEKQGVIDGAIACYREAIRLDPSQPAYKKDLDRALKKEAEREAKTAPPPREVKR